MLTYLIYVTEDLIATAILAALAAAYARSAQGRLGVRIVAVGIVLGLVLSVLMAVLKQTTNLVDTGLWNMRIFVVAAAALVLFLLCFVKPIARTRPGALAGQVFLSLFVFCRVFYKVPDVYLYPANFGIAADNLVSTDFAYRVIGYLAGILLVVLAAVALYKALGALGRRPIGISTALVASILGIVQVMTCLQTMLARRMIAQNHELFEAVKWFSNSSTLFMLAIVFVAGVLAVAVIAYSLRDKEPYSNPAEHRKNKAKWRNKRRWALCLLVCLVIASLTVTVIKDYDTRGPELSPSEECEIRDGNVYVSLDQVSDGHLHRFTYETQNGVGIRFIVIKKPNSSAYGIGLDACEICGQTGYYERDGQVVCKLCDVVMNINTIGFKGGCNPIPIEYAIADGFITVPTDGLDEYEKTFKS